VPLTQNPIADFGHHTVVRLAPPLVITREDLDFAIDRFEEILVEIVEPRRQGGGRARSGLFAAS
jgi:acetylornithine/succinyldiaminopimelate/putrescine aminotransferase